jgi:hypothetical protein
MDEQEEINEWKIDQDAKEFNEMLDDLEHFVDTLPETPQNKQFLRRLNIRLRAQIDQIDATLRDIKNGSI